MGDALGGSGTECGRDPAGINQDLRRARRMFFRTIVHRSLNYRAGEMSSSHATAKKLRAVLTGT
jgi:hypothetical protein